MIHETLTYDTDRLMFAVVCMAAVLIIGILIKEFMQ